MSDEDSLVNTKLHNKDIVNKFGKLEDKLSICVIDLELTCWDDGNESVDDRKEREIIEIGVAIIENRKKYKDISSFNRVVRPIKHTQLSKYCIDLTSISQKEVDEALTLKTVVDDLLKDGVLPNPREFVWAAWGDDAKWLQQELTLKGSSVEFDPRVLNLKVYQKLRGKSCGLKEALRLARIDQELPAHRALPDAISTAKLLKYMRLRPTDALVSKDKSYKETVKRLQKEKSLLFSKKYNLDEEKAFQLLNSVGWNRQKALHILRIFQN